MRRLRAFGFAAAAVAACANSQRLATTEFVRRELPTEVSIGRVRSAGNVASVCVAFSPSYHFAALDSRLPLRPAARLERFRAAPGELWLTDVRGHHIRVEAGLVSGDGRRVVFPGGVYKTFSLDRRPEMCFELDTHPGAAFRAATFQATDTVTVELLRWRSYTRVPAL